MRAYALLRGDYKKNMNAKATYTFQEIIACLSLLVLVATTAFTISGCSRKSDVAATDGEKTLDAEVSSKERPYFDAARPFAEAIATCDYSKAYGYLSSHAKARM